MTININNLKTQIEEGIDRAAHVLNKNIGRSFPVSYDQCIQIPLYCDYYGYILEVQYSKDKVTAVNLLRESQGYFDTIVSIIIRQNREIHEYIEMVLMPSYEE